MADKRTCPHCGKPVPPSAPGGICPECMLKAGLATRTEGPDATGPHGTKIVHPPPSPAEIGSLFPQLEILDCLGRGGMGVVYKARQPRLNRSVALKILAGEKEQDRQFAERFTREAQALARLSHPNIVTVYDFGETAGHYYLVMEFVDGLNLRQLLQAGKMPPEQALAIVPKICEALQYAHEQGIVHRDIKPENILLDKQGRVKIADFGIAKMLENGPGRPLPGHAPQTAGGPHGVAPPANLTEAGQTVGTPHYMAPEQIDKPRTVDHRADIFSLGVVFYEMLTGELPLGNFQPPSKKVHIDVRLDEVVLHALEKEPERRYQQASEIRTRVETIVASQTAPAPPTAANAPWKPAALIFNPFIRINGLPSLVLGLAVILLAGFIGSLSHTHFDGVLDTHIGAPTPWWLFLSEGLVDWLSLGLVLLIFGKAISNSPFRAVDLLGTQALARWPTIIISLVFLPPAVARFSNRLLEQFQQGVPMPFNSLDAAIFVAAMAAMVPLVCWMVWLMYKSYSLTARVKGGKAVGTFILALVLAEVLSKMLVYQLWKFI